jgi:hypothetical protein
MAKLIYLYSDEILLGLQQFSNPDWISNQMVSFASPFQTEMRLEIPK